MSRHALRSLRSSPAALWRRWLTPRRPARKRRSAPTLERLEDRTAPAVFTVTTLADVTDPNDGVVSLREAITSANSEAGDDTITFAVTGTINLTGPLPELSTSLAIEGPGAGSLTVRRDSGGNYRIFSVGERATVALSGLTVRNGNSASGGGGNSALGGGIFNNGGTLTLTDCTVSGNSAATAGGGIFNNGGTLTLTGCTVSGNSAATAGG